MLKYFWTWYIKTFPGRAGGEGAADRPGVGAAEHAGRPYAPGGQGDL